MVKHSIRRAIILLIVMLLVLTAAPSGISPAQASAFPCRVVVQYVREARVYSGPGENFRVIGAAEKGTVLTVLSARAFSDGWRMIDFHGRPGFIRQRYTGALGYETETMRLGKVKRMATIRAGTSAQADILGTAGAGRKYTVLDESDSWYKILYNGKTGYVGKDYLETGTHAVSQSSRILLKAATFNVHNLNLGRNASEVAALLKETGADVVGVQEIDQYVGRSGSVDWAAQLASLSGYPYYAFAPTMPYGGGLYGTLILSRYPIIQTQVLALSTASGAEPRVLAYARILTDSGAVDMYNTHLSFESVSANAVCLRSLADKLSAAGRTRYFLTGDFNTTPDVIAQYLRNMSPVNTAHVTHNRDGVWVNIDNILYTGGISAYGLSVKDAVASGVSDHRLVSAMLAFEK